MNFDQLYFNNMMAGGFILYESPLITAQVIQAVDPDVKTVSTNYAVAFTGTLTCGAVVNIVRGNLKPISSEINRGDEPDFECTMHVLNKHGEVRVYTGEEDIIAAWLGGDEDIGSCDNLRT